MSGLREIRGIVGEDHAREAAEGDRIRGVQPRWVAAPADREEIAALLDLAGRNRWAVAPRGGASKLALGNAPERLDLIVETRRLDRVLEHAAGDLVVIAEAGVRLQDLQRRLRESGQMLALDPPETRATLGGIVASNASGPRRLRYGTVRDLLIGIQVVLPDGTLARSGGRVVKNVAGYDLGKLYTGSLGTLGVVVETIFRLHPLPPARRVVEVRLSDPAGAGEVVQRLFRSHLVPSAIELDSPAESDPRVYVLFEGSEPGVEAQAREAVEMLGASGEAAETESRLPAPREPGALEVKIATVPSELAGMIRHVLEVCDSAGARPHLHGQIGAAVLRVSVGPVSAAAAGAIVRGIRAGLLEGSAVVTTPPERLDWDVDAWGDPGDAIGLMRRVKERFDPLRTLNPGRFVGGI